MFDQLARTTSRSKTLKKIKASVDEHSFAHIISLNTENFVEATQNADFHTAYIHAEIVICDGMGISLAGFMLGTPAGERIAGVDCMADIINAHKDKRIVFVGGQKDTAQRTFQYFCQTTSQNNPPWHAIIDAQKDDPGLIEQIGRCKPDILFLAFGSPFQELWIENHREQLQGVVCMGVGQAMDVYGGLVQRAPKIMRAVGLEWLFRLYYQPWRWKRQVRLLQFIHLLIRQRLWDKA